MKECVDVLRSNITSRRPAEALQIALLVNVETINPHDGQLLAANDGKVENDVLLTLCSLGHKVTVVPLGDSMVATLERLLQEGPDIVFNLTEHYHGDRDRDAMVATLLEQIGLPFTGGSSRTLTLCRDKSVSKFLVARKGIEVPRHAILHSEEPSILDQLPFPCVVKPLRGDGGDLITRAALVTTKSKAKERAMRIRAATGQAAIVEEFIDGDEYSVTLTGMPSEAPRVWAVTHLEIPSSAPSPLVTLEVKSAGHYRQRHRISYSTVHLECVHYGALVDAATRTFVALGIDGWARLEFRIRGGVVYFLEANPNSNLDADSQSTPYQVFGHEEFLFEIIRLGTQRTLESRTQ